jgi:hypothetical protein
MVIATSKKDRLRSEAGAQLAPVQTVEIEAEDPLRFHTGHPDKPCFVDLVPYAEGVSKPKKNDPRWQGSYKGRPELILELAPAIRDALMPLSPRTVDAYKSALTSWWRLIDEMESAMPSITGFRSSSDFTELHGQRAVEKGIASKHILLFLSILRVTRTVLKLRPLFWTVPSEAPGTRHLALPEHFKAVRIAIKHDWFAAVDRWALADELLRRGQPVVSEESPNFAEQHRLLENYRCFKKVVTSTKRVRPDTEDIRGPMNSSAFTKYGYSVPDMLAGFYPSGSDVRAAFHLCLAVTGWNPAVLLDLEVKTKVINRVLTDIAPFIEEHPTDTARFIMRGIKARAGDTEQVHEGFFKSQGGAAFILHTLILRTAPLRKELRLTLRGLKKQWDVFEGSKTSGDAVILKQRINGLELAIRSPWLYCAGTHGSDATDFSYLHLRNFAGGQKDVHGKSVTYLVAKIHSLNIERDKRNRIPHIRPGDFRDAYARDVYHASGGNILAVYKALGHRSIHSTVIYVTNTLLNEEHSNLFGGFVFVLWEEMDLTGIVDPSILAKRSRDGSINDESRKRLHDYRSLKRSRLGIGCKDPCNPPKRVDPNFLPNGKKVCNQHRCTLCKENGVIFPDSLDGLCMRLAELMHLKERMGVGHFMLSDFPEEMKNTEDVLSSFDQARVQERLAYWQEQIAQGLHRVMEFNGA